MYTIETKADRLNSPQRSSLGGWPTTSVDVRIATETRSERPIKDILGYFEPALSLEQSFFPKVVSHAVFVLDGSDQIRSKNYLAQEVIDEQQLFRLDNGFLEPILESELPYWARQLAELRKTRRPRIAILAGLYSRVAVGLSLRAQGDVEVHVESGLKIQEQLLQIFCDSAGITTSEKEVLRWVLAGLKPKAIAQIRSRSEATVRSHVKNALAKSGCSSVPELISMVTRMPDFV